MDKNPFKTSWGEDKSLEFAPNEAHEGKPNYDSFKQLHAMHGEGHFAYHPETGDIHASSPKAIDMVTQLRAPAPVKTIQTARDKMISADIQQWAPANFKPKG